MTLLVRSSPRPRLLGTGTAEAAAKANFNMKSRAKLKPADAPRLAYDSTFGSLAAAVCHAGVLPRKELFECWHVATRVHAAFPHATRIADLAAGHGLLSWMLAALACEGTIQRTATPPRTAVCVDVAKPQSAETIARCITDALPWLSGSVEYVEGSIDAAHDASGSTVFVGVHACGSLSDRILDVAMRGQPSPVALLPCCHSLRKHTALLLENGAEGGFDSASVLRGAASAVGPSAAIDLFRLERLRRDGYSVDRSFIPREITPYNRLLIGRPPSKMPSTRPSQFTSLWRTRGEASQPDGRGFKGELRAWQAAVHIPVSPTLEDRAIITALAQRPRAEWLRSFDTSLWTDPPTLPAAEAQKDFLSNSLGAPLLAFMLDATIRGQPLTRAEAEARAVAGAAETERPADQTEEEAAVQVDSDGVMVRAWVLSRYEQPGTGRRALTIRTEMRSTLRSISRKDATSWQAKVREALVQWAERDGDFELR